MDGEGVTNVGKEGVGIMSDYIMPFLSSIRFDSYKSFDKDGPFRMNVEKNITLIIGRNNCGKSSLIDVVEGLVNAGTSNKLPKGMENVCPSFKLDERHLEYGFSKTSRNNRLYGTEFVFASRFINYDFTVRIGEKGYTASEKQEDYRIFLSSDGKDGEILDNWNTVARLYSKSLQSVSFRRINAERDIMPEMEDEGSAVDENGNGATNLVRKYLNIETLNEAIVEKTLLNELNRIMEPDAHFSSIRVQQVRENNEDEYRWEIYLEEGDHRYAMSKSGSGLKTILLVLINLYLIPDTNSYKHREICYAFEELENNLHPALQRRVFDYLYRYAVEKNIKIFITSHSHIAINTFYGKEQASIYHVIKENGHSNLISISNGERREQILEDLDVKASDLFQSNGIIWVEGPSDRIYILRWLEVFTDFNYIEGMHFQFMYYGGRLLAHFEAEEQENRTDGLINILTTNRHASIIMDSDKRYHNSSINGTKKRVRKEFEEKGFFCWVTKGKEIENYISADAVNDAYDCTLSQIGQYELFPEYISKLDSRFASHKVDAARKISEHITADNSKEILDLKKQIERLYEEIKKWN